MDLSVIIVSFNVRDLLKQCLHSVGESIAMTDYEVEVFVVDNNSSDGSADMVKNEFPWVRLIVNDHNAGFSVANNQAIRISEGKFILLLNPDTIIKNDTLQLCFEFMKLHDDAGALGVRMVNGNGCFLPESKRTFPTPSSAFFKTFGFSFFFPRSKIMNRYYLPQVDSLETSTTEVISGAFMMVRRQALEKSGLLDEDFFMYGEDIDLSYRLMKTGYKNYYYPEVEIIHLKGMSTSRKGYNDIRYFYQAMRIYVRKRAGEKRSGFLTPLLLTGIYTREGIAKINRFFKLLIQ